jgi:predicted metalloprotease with PDZ domain
MSPPGRPQGASPRRQAEGTATGLHRQAARGRPRSARPLPALAAVLAAVIVAASALPAAPAAAQAPAAPQAAPAQASASAAPAPSCNYHYSIAPRFLARPRGFEVTLSFDAGDRRETLLRLNDGFAGQQDLSRGISGWSAEGTARVLPTADLGTWRVMHDAQQRVTVRYQVRGSLDDADSLQPQEAAQQYRPQVGANWLQFFGHAALVNVETGVRSGAQGQVHSCLIFERMPARSIAATSRGSGPANEVEVVAAGTPTELMNSFYAAGTGWRLLTRKLASGNLHIAIRNFWPMRDEQFADQVARVIDTQRGFWGHEREADQLVVLTSNQAPGVRNTGVRVHRAAVLHVARDFRPDGSTFNELVGHENLHEWIPGRLGGTNTGAAGLQTWFSEGFTDYYTHRLLLRSGAWTLQRYADELTAAMRQYRQSPYRHMGNAEAARRRLTDRDIGQLPYLRGEILALRWDAALRAQGKPGLDAVMRSLLLPPGPASANRAPPVDRLFAALKPLLGEAPRQDVARHVDEAADFEFGPGLLGPCFAFDSEQVPPWTLGFAYQSFEAGRAIGVEPDGPAAAAGLREGMALAGWSLPGRDGTGEVELVVVRGGGTSRITYRPEGRGLIEQPRYRARADAASDPACKAWLER